MPRRNNKKGNKVRVTDSGSDDGSMSDNASVSSFVSEVPSSTANDVNDPLSNENAEDEFKQALDNVTEKAVKTRTLALQSMCESLMHRYMPDFIDSRKETILDCIEKSIRRGKGVEQMWAALLAPLTMLQLGGDQIVCQTLNPYLLTNIQDPSVSFGVRAKCCTALGLINFLGGEDFEFLYQLMQTLEGIYSGSYLRGDDKTRISVNAEEGSLHAAALSAWALLLTLVPPEELAGWNGSKQNMLPSIKHLMGMLQSPHLDVRTTAGETLALIVECGRMEDEEFLDDYKDDLIDAMKQLATDSHKYRAKRDRKVQRATFRDIMRFIDADISPEIDVRFGKECLTIDSWVVHHHYSTLCSVVGPGMTSHLRENDLIRDILQLGAKVNKDDRNTRKMSKVRRNFHNAAACKARTISRNKSRDKRSVAFN